VAFAVEKNISVKIEKMVYGVYGLGRMDGKVVFVPFTAPGDLVSVEPVQEKKGFIEARLISIEEPSALRTEPFCPVFGQCGGCQYQHLKYEDQLRVKTEILKDSLTRLKGKEAFELLPMIPSARDRACRIRAQLKIGGTEKGPFLGFYRFRTHEVVKIEICPMLDLLADDVLRKSAAWIEKKGQMLSLRGVDILASPDEGAASLRIHGDRFPEKAEAEKIMEEIDTVKGVAREGKRKGFWGTATLWLLAPSFERDEPLRMGVDQGSFFQTNADQNRELIRKVMEWAALTGKERVLDLFCGGGNLTLPLARKAKEVWGIDADRGAVARAAENARQNKLGNCRFIADTAAAGIRQIPAGGEPFDLVVLDPPRAGAKEVMDFLARLRPTKILYVSCEPPTLVRDLVRLADLSYNISRIQALDMFPQTYHMEVIAELSANRDRESREINS